MMSHFQFLMASSLQCAYCHFLLISVSFFLVFCSGNGYNGVTTKCLHPPIASLPNGCSVSNLAVSSTGRNNLLVSDWKCNQTVDSSEFDHIPIIKFLNMPIAFQRNQTYLITVVDKTTNQLLWMVANVTVVNKTLSPGNLPWHGSFKNSFIIKSYQPPSVSFHSNNHSVEFLIFEEKFNKPSALSQMTHSIYDRGDDFSLRNWLQMETATGQVTFCGPVGGGVVIAYKRPTSGPLYPISDNNPRPSTYSPYNPYPVPPAQYPPNFNQHGAGSHNNPPASPVYPPNYSSNQNYYPSAKGNLKKSNAYSLTSNVALIVINIVSGLLYRRYHAITL